MKKATGGHPRTNSIRSFVKAKKQALNASSVFSEDVPSDSIAPRLVQEARKTGVLNLASKNLSQIPPKVWSLNEIQKDEGDALSVALDSSSDQRWWEFAELQKLVIANNCISLIPDDIQKLSFLQVFDAHDNHISIIPKEFGLLENLVKVDLSRNRIEELPVELYRLKRLTELRLSNNAIRELSEELGNFSSLNLLELSNNQIAKLPPDIGFLSSLTTLNLAKNKLELLPSDFSSLTGLRHLDLSENFLTDLGSLLSEFCRLEILYLQQNKMKKIPNLQNASHLIELYMRDNQVVKFSSRDFTGTQIRFIDLRANKISDIEIALEDLELLDRFLLDNNDIQNLPTELPFLPSLKQLTLEGNPLKGIRVDILQRGSVELLKYLKGKHVGPPPSPNQLSMTSLSGSNLKVNATKTRKSSGGGAGPAIEPDIVVDIHKMKATGQLTITGKQVIDLAESVFLTASDAGVTKVDLSHNFLMGLPSSFESVCVKLRELNLDRNKLTNLPSCIGNSAHLYYITFQNNQISDLPKEFANLQKLREINLSFNKFTAIPLCLYDLPVLEILIAQDNKIEAIDVAGLKKLTKLATLVLDNNNISACPPEVGLLPLTRLSIQGNAFRIPPYHVLAKGTEATMVYLRNRILPP